MRESLQRKQNTKQELKAAACVCKYRDVKEGTHYLGLTCDNQGPPLPLQGSSHKDPEPRQPEILGT